MQKHYKLIMGLLVCVLGTGLKGAQAPASYTRAAVAALRVATRSCAVPPQDFFTLLLLSEAHQDPLERILSARRRVVLHAVKNMYVQLEGVAALGAAPEFEGADGAAAARQTAEGVAAKSLKEDLNLINFVELKAGMLQLRAEFLADMPLVWTVFGSTCKPSPKATSQAEQLIFEDLQIPGSRDRRIAYFKKELEIDDTRSNEDLHLTYFFTFD